MAPLGVLVAAGYVDSVIVFWGHPLWMQLLAATVVAAAAVVMSLWVRMTRPGRRRYASADARLAITRRRRGWYIADHAARPGTTGEGHRLRLGVRDSLTAAADAQQVIVFAHTDSMKLARAYMADIPRLRIASIRGSRILLVRVPRRTPATASTSRPGE